MARLSKQDQRQDGQVRQGCGVEVAFADDPGGGGAYDEACGYSCECEDEGFEEKHAP